MTFEGSVVPSSSTAAVGGGSVRKQVYDQLRQAILEMNFAPGRRLVERELVEMTGASRSSVREAIRQLETDGLVKSVPHNKVVVAVPSLREAQELYEVRGILESLEVRKFVEAASEADIVELEDALEHYRSATDVASRLQAKDEFYATLGSHAPTTYEILDRLNARIAFMRTLSLSSPGRHQDSVAEIDALVKAIRGRDADHAAAVCLKHADRAREVVVEILAQNPWFADLRLE